MIHEDARRMINRPLHHRVTFSWPLVALRGSPVLLAVLFLGPLIAPLFQATRLPLVADTGALARDLLARYICPTPAKSYVLLGFPMAVCARCWGATIGLWGAWLAVVRLARPGPTQLRSATGWMQRYVHLHWLARFGKMGCNFSISD